MSQAADLFLSDEVRDIIYYDLMKKGYTQSQVSDMLQRKPYKIEETLNLIGLVLCDVCELEFIADGYYDEWNSLKMCVDCCLERYTDEEREEMFHEGGLCFTEFYGY